MLLDRQILLGVGLGLLMGATVTAVGGGHDRPLSRMEIVRRAKALGMSFQGEERLNLGGPAPSGANQALVPTPAAAPSVAPAPTPATPATVTVVVPPGATVGEVARLLRAKMLIADEGEFLHLAETRRAEARVLPGTYRFKSDVTVKGLIAALLSGPRAE